MASRLRIRDATSLAAAVVSGRMTASSSDDAFFETHEPDKYLALLDSAYRAHADVLTKSADKGTDMHAELEYYVERIIADGGAHRQERHGAGRTPERRPRRHSV